MVIDESCSEDNNLCDSSVDFSSNVNNGFQYEYASYAYECLNSFYPLGKYNLSSALVTYIVVGVDFALLLFFLFFLCSEDKAEEKE